MSTARVASVPLAGSAGSGAPATADVPATVGVVAAAGVRGTADVSSTAKAWLTPVELLLLAAIWGASFLFQRVAAKDFGAFPLVEVRLFLGSLVLMPFLWRARGYFNLRLWLRLAGIGIINSAIPFVLFAWGAQHAPAGIGAIANATAVMFTALVALIFYGEAITTRRAMGLIAGFIGVAVLASGKTNGVSVWPAALAGTAASVLYGFGGNLIRRQLVGLPAAAVAAATLFCASMFIAPLALATWPAGPVPVVSWGCAVLLGVMCTGIAFALYYRLINRIGAPRASTVTYLVPLFGVLWAWLALGEPLTVTMAVAGALILGGVALNQQWGGLRKPQG
jgi:drug/metabolite transporter (DMT)-like permease